MYTSINVIELNIFYLLKILANGIGHKLWQQLFKTNSLQLTTNYIHDSNHTVKYRYFTKRYTNKQAKLEKESKKETWYLLKKEIRNVYKK